MTATPKHVYEVYIRTTPERLWRAITDPAETRLYYYHSDVQSDWQPGSKMLYSSNGEVSLDCEIVDIEPGKKLVHTFRAVYDPEVAAEPATRVTWEIEQMGGACRLRITHDEFPSENRTFREVEFGWSHILSGLKTLIETGQPLEIEEPVESPA